MSNRKKVVIAGGGFAGLRLAKGLAGSSYDVVLIDRQNHHMFQPLFYQVATAGLDPSSISFPFRKIFQKAANVRFRMAEVVEVQTGNKKLITSDGELSYDFLVLATGCTTNFFGNQGIAAKAYTMKSTREALDIKYGILAGFERIETASADEKESLMTVVIAGGGPTGVELAGAFAEMKKHILPKDYPGIDFSKFRIILLEGSPNTLNSMSEASRSASARYLRELGVDVRTQVMVTGYDGNKVTLNSGETITSAHFVWAAGVTGNVIGGTVGGIIERGRYQVDRFNRIEGLEGVFAIGDVALMKTPLYPQGHPQVANVAIGQAENLVHNFRKLEKGQPMLEYEYKDLGSMATVGKHKAVVDLPWIRFQGYLAWMVWMSLHLMLILSVKNRLIIFINWCWSYFTNDSSLRIILKSNKRS